MTHCKPTFKIWVEVECHDPEADSYENIDREEVGAFTDRKAALAAADRALLAGRAAACTELTPTAQLLSDARSRLVEFIGTECECDNTHKAAGTVCCLCEYRAALLADQPTFGIPEIDALSEVEAKDILARIFCWMRGDYSGTGTFIDDKEIGGADTVENLNLWMPPLAESKGRDIPG